MQTPKQMAGIKKRFISGALAALLLKLVGAALSYLMFVALARAMPFEQFGIFSFAFGLSTILAKVAVAGQQQYLVRDLPRHLGAAREDALARDVLTTRSYVTVLGVSSFLMGSLLLAVLTPGIFGSGERSALIFAALFIPIMAFSELLTSTLRAYGDIVRGLAPREILWRGVICLACFGVAFSAGPILDAGIGFAIVAGLLGVIILAQAAMWPETRVWRQKFNRASFRAHPWLVTSGHLAVTSTVLFGVPMLSVVVVGLILSPAETGPLFAALKTAQTMGIVLMATNLVASPLISRAYFEGKTARVQKICAACAVAGTGFALLIFTFLIPFGDDVLRLFGADFAAGYPELIIFSLAYVVHAACGANGVLLDMTKHEAQHMRVMVFSNALGLCLLPVLTALYGTIGAASAVAGSIILWNLLAVLAARRHADVDPSVFGVLRLSRT
ncbi:MAG: MATE family efflux transporter [Pseudomonadota bacterium]